MEHYGEPTEEYSDMDDYEEPTEEYLVMDDDEEPDEEYPDMNNEDRPMEELFLDFVYHLQSLWNIPNFGDNVDNLRGLLIWVMPGLRHLTLDIPPRPAPVPYRSEARLRYFARINLDFYEDPDPVCPICLEPFEGEEHIAVILTNVTCPHPHLFGLSCIERWANTAIEPHRQNCPICRSPIGPAFDYRQLYPPFWYGLPDRYIPYGELIRLLALRAAFPYHQYGIPPPSQAPPPFMHRPGPRD